MINLGLEYEDIEAIALEICEIVMAAENYRGDIICPGVLPNYGPHVSKPCVAYPIMDLSNLINLMFLSKSLQFNMCATSVHFICSFSLFSVRQRKMVRTSAPCTTTASQKLRGQKQRMSTILSFQNQLPRKQLTHM